MPTDDRNAAAAPAWRQLLLPALLAFGLGGLSFWWQGDVGISLRDEGYLWYGVLGVLEGELPLRDFQAYDPGRYVWCALWSPLVGSGLLGVRAATAVFGALGLFLGLLAARRVVRTPLGLAATALLLHVWMFPRHKLYESALTMAAAWVAVRLVERPTPRRHAEAGLFVGLAACFGRNHGLYAGLALGALALFVALRRGVNERPSLARNGACLALGTLAGYAPMLVLFAAAPGFAKGYVDAALLILEQGANLPAPYPWPWRVDLSMPIVAFGRPASVSAIRVPSRSAWNSSFMDRPPR